MGAGQLKYYLIDSGKAAAHRATPEWNAVSKRELHCVCGNRLPKVRGVDVELAKPPVNVPLTAVGLSSIGVIRDDLQRAIGEVLFDEVFYTGVVSTPRGVDDRYRSFVGKHALTVRGNATSWFRFCAQCQSTWYLGLGDLYVLGRDVSEGRAVYATRRCPIVIREDVANRVLQARIQKVSIQQIDVLEQPLDDLPSDLGDAPRDVVRGQFD